MFKDRAFSNIYVCEYKGNVIRKFKNSNKVENKEIVFEDFIVNKGETAIGKYGDVLN